MEPIPVKVISTNSHILICNQDGDVLTRVGFTSDGELAVQAADLWWCDTPEDFESTADATLDTTFESHMSDRDRVLALIRESYTQKPTQTRSETSAITKTIARQVYGADSHRNVMRVAGIRAANTRGVYDQD